MLLKGVWWKEKIDLLVVVMGRDNPFYPRPNPITLQFVVGSQPPTCLWRPKRRELRRGSQANSRRRLLLVKNISWTLQVRPSSGKQMSWSQVRKKWKIATLFLPTPRANVPSTKFKSILTSSDSRLKTYLFFLYLFTPLASPCFPLRPSSLATGLKIILCDATIFSKRNHRLTVWAALKYLAL